MMGTNSSMTVAIEKFQYECDLNFSNFVLVLDYILIISKNINSTRHKTY